MKKLLSLILLVSVIGLNAVELTPEQRAERRAQRQAKRRTELREQGLSNDARAKLEQKKAERKAKWKARKEKWTKKRTVRRAKSPEARKAERVAKIEQKLRDAGISQSDINILKNYWSSQREKFRLRSGL